MRTLIAALLALCLLPRSGVASEIPPCGFVPPFSESPMRATRDRPPSDGQLDSEVYPIRVHFLDGDQDLAPLLLEVAEISWEQQVVDWGWDAPGGDEGLGGDDSLDFYLYDTEFGGYASPDDWFNTATHVRCYGHIVINRLMDPDGIRMTTPHEFNHVLQMWTDCLEDGQLFEASAVYAEDWPFPELDYAWSFASAFQGGYYRSLDFYDYAEPPQYGSFIFLQFLAERFGDGTPVSTLELWNDATQGDWENTNTWMDALERWLESLWPEDMPGPGDGELYTELAWQEFGEWRWFLGEHADGEHLQHGHPDAPYGLELIPIGTASRATLEQGAADIDLPHAMAELSAGVIEVRHPHEDWTLSAELTADGGEDRWTLSLISLDEDEGVGGRERGAIGQGAAQVSSQVPPGTEIMLLVVANVGDGILNPNEDDWDGTDAVVIVDAGQGTADDDDDGGDDDTVLEPGGNDCTCRIAPPRDRSAAPLLVLLVASLIRRRLRATRALPAGRRSRR